MLNFSPYFNEFLIVAFAMFVALLSPGPDFAMVLKQSVTQGRKASIYSSIGIGLGISVHVVYTILGIGLIISKSIVLFSIVKFLGAFYLIYIGYKSLKSSGFELQADQTNTVKQVSNKKSFMMGFLCNALNPKATLFFLSLFTVIISIDTPIYIQSIYGVFCIFATMAWFTFLSLVLSQDRVRRFFNNFGKWFDRTVGVVLISLGITIAFSK
ncbi:LysE family translocator [Poseidonibacter lekithochrous]|uniref:LysE family translocator n=1 Tax=Poseidonibacter lekithochrous TaxID=1904463 RepID=UPI000D3B8828|nr:LysE family translocator [Poseidonibacter lekithochrous]